MLNFFDDLEINILVFGVWDSDNQRISYRLRAVKHFWHEIFTCSGMSGITKIVAGVFARVLDFAFSGYGLVCDAVILKIIFQHFRYRYLRYRNLWETSRIIAYIRYIRIRPSQEPRDGIRYREY